MSVSLAESLGIYGKTGVEWRYEARAVVRRLAQGDFTADRDCSFRRTASCGLPMGQDVQIHAFGSEVSPVNLSTCGSVWVCPCCSAKIRVRRAMEVESAASAHAAAGGDLAMLTLTVRHKRNMALSKVLAGVRKAWRRLQQSKDWKGTKELLVGTIRGLEVTLGPNGWHVHLHVLLFVAPGVPRGLVDLRAAGLFDRWASGARSVLGVAPDRVHGISLVWMEDGGAAYVSKLQEAGLEVAYSDGKRGRYPFALLDGVAAGDLDSVQLWREYADGMKGARAIGWSVGLRDLYAVGPELTDQELADDGEGGRVVDVVPVDEWLHLNSARASDGRLLVIHYFEDWRRRLSLWPPGG